MDGAVLELLVAPAATQAAALAGHWVAEFATFPAGTFPLVSDPAPRGVSAGLRRPVDGAVFKGAVTATSGEAAADAAGRFA